MREITQNLKKSIKELWGFFLQMSMRVGLQIPRKKKCRITNPAQRESTQNVKTLKSDRIPYTEKKGGSYCRVAFVPLISFVTDACLYHPFVQLLDREYQIPIATPYNVATIQSELAELFRVEVFVVLRMRVPTDEITNIDSAISAVVKEQSHL